MKRCLTKLVVFLLLGAIVNVAVAWGCAAWMPLVSIPGGVQNYLVSQDEALWWARWVPNGFISRPVVSSRASTWGLRAAYVSAERADRSITLTTDATGLVTGITGAPAPNPVYFDHVMFIRSGWPLSAFQGARWIMGKGQRGQPRLAAALEIPPASGSATMVNAVAYDRPSARGGEYRIIPTAVMPIGFAVNTLIYGVLLWLLALGSFAMRRHIRRKRGLCLRCGYDLRGAEHDVCPECGADGSL